LGGSCLSRTTRDLEEEIVGRCDLCPEGKSFSYALSDVSLYFEGDLETKDLTCGIVACIAYNAVTLNTKETCDLAAAAITLRGCCVEGYVLPPATAPVTGTCDLCLGGATVADENADISLYIQGDPESQGITRGSLSYLVYDERNAETNTAEFCRNAAILAQVGGCCTSPIVGTEVVGRCDLCDGESSFDYQNSDLSVYVEGIPETKDLTCGTVATYGYDESHFDTNTAELCIQLALVAQAGNCCTTTTTGSSPSTSSPVVTTGSSPEIAPSPPAEPAIPTSTTTVASPVSAPVASSDSAVISWPGTRMLVSMIGLTADEYPSWDVAAPSNE